MADKVKARPKYFWEAMKMTIASSVGSGDVLAATTIMFVRPLRDNVALQEEI